MQTVLTTEQGVYFDEISSPVVKMTTLHMLLVLVAKNDLDLFQVYIKTAFLHGDLNEEIYMEQAKDYEVYGKMPLVYSLTQSPRKWYKKFSVYEVPKL